MQNHHLDANFGAQDIFGAPTIFPAGSNFTYGKRDNVTFQCTADHPITWRPFQVSTIHLVISERFQLIHTRQISNRIGF